MKKFSLFIPTNVAAALEAAAKANGLRPSALMRVILQRGLDIPINFEAPRKASGQ